MTAPSSAQPSATVGASYVAPPQLTRLSAISFASSDPHAVADYLRTLGYVDRTPCQHEVARVALHGAIAAIYRTGTLLVQGGNPAPLRALLAALCAESAVLV